MPDAVCRHQEFPDPMYEQNSRVLSLEGHPDCWLIDPGLPPAARDMCNYISENALEPTAVILTHAHADHIAGLQDILVQYPHLPTYLAREEWQFLQDPTQNLSEMIGLALRVEVPDLRDLVEGDSLPLADSTWEISDTSGHSPGGRTLYCAALRIAVVGDALFAGSIGRMDFPHSDGPRLLANIRSKLLTLPGETVVLSGHGPQTTIDTERRSNPFVGEASEL